MKGGEVEVWGEKNVRKIIKKKREMCRVKQMCTLEVKKPPFPPRDWFHQFRAPSRARTPRAMWRRAGYGSVCPCRHQTLWHTGGALLRTERALVPILK
jgi:hypothetical protein